MKAALALLAVLGLAALGLVVWQVFLVEEPTATGPELGDPGTTRRAASANGGSGASGRGGDEGTGSGDLTPTPIPEDAPPVRLVHGRVFRDGGGALPEARITALAEKSRPRETVSDAEGRFSLEGPPWPAFRVVVTAKGHAARRFVDVTPDSELDVSLQPAVAFAGTVNQAGVGPVSRAEVSLRPSGRADLEAQETKTDAKGRFTFPEIAPGVWDVAIRRHDLAPHHETGLVIPASGDFTKDFVLFGGLTLTGTVLRKADRALIKGAVIMVRDRVIGGEPIADQSRLMGPYTSDAQGRFVVPGLAPGRVQLWVRGRGFQCAIAHHDLAGVRPKDTQFEVLLEEDIPVKGLVVGPDDRPVPEARILFRPEGQADLNRATELAAFLIEAETWRDGVDQKWPAVYADHRGQFTLSGVPAWAKFHLEARDAEERLASSEPVPVHLQGRTEALEVVLRLAAPRRIGSRVVDERGDPLAGVVITLGSTRALTDREGRFSLTVSESTVGRLTTHLADWLPVAIDVDLDKGQGLPELIRLERGDLVRGVVLDRAARPVIGARITLHRVGAHARDLSGVMPLTASTSGLDGSFLVGGFKAPKVRLSVSHPAYVTAVIDEVSPGPSPLELRLDPRLLEGTGDVTGQVVDGENGVPLPEFTVAGISGARQLRFQGHFVLQNLEPGRHRIVIDGIGRQRHVIEDVTVRPGELTRVGQVRLHRGQPLGVTLRDDKGRAYMAKVEVTVEEKAGQGNPPEVLRLHRAARNQAVYQSSALRLGPYRVIVSDRVGGQPRVLKTLDFVLGPAPKRLVIPVPRR